MTETLTCLKCKHVRTEFPSLVTSTSKDGQHHYRKIRCPKCKNTGYDYRATFERSKR